MFQCEPMDVDLLDVDREREAYKMQGDALAPLADSGSVIVADLNRQVSTGDAGVILTYDERQLAGIITEIRGYNNGNNLGYMVYPLAPDKEQSRMVSLDNVFCAAAIVSTYADPEIFRSSYPTGQKTCDESCDFAQEGRFCDGNSDVNDGASGRVSMDVSFGATFADFFLSQGAVLMDTTTRDRFRHRDGVLQWMLDDGSWVTCHYGSLRNRAESGYDNQFVYDDVLTADRPQLNAEQADQELQVGHLVTDFRSNDQFRLRDGTLYVRAGTKNPWEQARYTRLSDVEEPAGCFFVVGSTLSEAHTKAASA